MEEKELTVQDVFESMTEEQQEFCMFLMGMAAEEAGLDVDKLEHSDEGMSEDELMHYGVLGMKWGVHRAQKKGTDYSYKSHRQKRTEKKLNKAIKKGKSADKIATLQRALKVYKQRDKNREAYARSVSVGRTLWEGLKKTPFYKGSYNRLRSAGYDHKGANQAIRTENGVRGFSKREEMRTAEIQVRNREKK